MIVTGMRGLTWCALFLTALMVLGCEGMRQIVVTERGDAEQELARITDVKVETREANVQIIVTSSKSLVCLQALILGLTLQREPHFTR